MGPSLVLLADPPPTHPPTTPLQILKTTITGLESGTYHSKGNGGQGRGISSPFCLLSSFFFRPSSLLFILSSFFFLLSSFFFLLSSFFFFLLSSFFFLLSSFFFLLSTVYSTLNLMVGFIFARFSNHHALSLRCYLPILSMSHF